MCSITLDALLLQRGIPLNPIGGGIVEVIGRVPQRFTSMILYRDTTLDPLEVLISQEATSILGVMHHGSGNILANIRECHMEAESLMETVLDELAAIGFSGILDIGAPNVPLLGVPVSPQYVGVAIVGGTNAMAAVREARAAGRDQGAQRPDRYPGYGLPGRLLTRSPRPFRDAGDVPPNKRDKPRGLRVEGRRLLVARPRPRPEERPGIVHQEDTRTLVG